MKSPKTLILFFLVMVVFVTQVGAVSAAPAAGKTVGGRVTVLACETDTVTGEMLFLVTLEATNGTLETVRIDQVTAESLGLVQLTIDGIPDCTPAALANALGMEVTIDSTDIIPDEEEAQHPVGAALATFFGDITNYAAIMDAHENGAGFGVIAQALWLTKKLEGDTDTFLAILLAKQTGDYSAFTFEDGTPVPQNWGQFRKLLLDGDKKNSLGIVMSNKDKDHASNGSSNGNGQGNGNGNGTGQGNGNGNPDKNNDKGNNGNNEDKGNGKTP